MNKKIIFTLAKKEFFDFINSSLAYVITIPFLITSSFLFFRFSLVSGEANLRFFFETLPWLFLLLVPALSMKLLSEEQRGGTLELLFGHPISELEIVLGKFFGAFIFLLLVLALTLGLPVSLFLFSKPDFGIIIGQYLGAIFLSSAFLAIGLASSTYFKNSIASFLTAISISFVFILIGLDMVILMLPWPVNKIVNEIALLPHVNNIARGLIDIRDIIYFFTLTGVFLLGAVIKLASRRTSEDKEEKRKLKLIFSLIMVVGIGLNVFIFKYPLRLDLTKQKLFSLSRGTKQTLKDLKDEVKIFLYASRNLPGPIQPTFKQVEDLLRDYQRFGKKVNLRIFYPDLDSQIADEAKKNGILEISFNRMGTDKFEVQTGYLGLVIKYKDKTETIPFINKTGDLEYQVTRRIRKLTRDKQQTIGFVNLNPMARNQQFQKDLRTQYEVKNISLDSMKKLADLDALVVIDPGTEEEATAAGVLKQFLASKGKVLALVSGVNVNVQFLTSSKSISKIPQIFSDYGISLNSDLVYDLQLNETVTLGQGNVRYLLPYPFWLKALVKSDKFPSLTGIKTVSLAWPSSLSLIEKKGQIQTVFLQTSLNAGQQKEKFAIAPEKIKSLRPSERTAIPLGVAVVQGETKLAVIGNTIMAEDQFGENNPSNFNLLVNLVDWLVADKTLAAIPNKLESSNPYRFTSSDQAAMVQYANTFLPSILIAVFALFWLKRRKNLTLRKFR